MKSFSIYLGSGRILQGYADEQQLQAITNLMPSKSFVQTKTITYHLHPVDAELSVQPNPVRAQIKTNQIDAILIDCIPE